MHKEEEVIRSYVLMNKLKDVVRTGWKDWNVDRVRVESIAEHIYGVQQLAIIMHSEYEEYKDIDLEKVILMLAIHETEEAFIGDITMFQDEAASKKERGHKAVHDYFSNFIDGEKLEEIVLEFDERKTKEAKFAYQCDKLECDIQAALYSDNVDLNNQQNNTTFNDERVQKLLDQGMSFGEMWITFGQSIYPYDENFRSVSEYTKENINKLRKETPNLTCSYCTKHCCYHRDLDNAPKNCPTVNNKEELEGLLKEYLEYDNYNIARVSSDVTIENYNKASRLKEIILFCKKMGYNRIGLAFCYNVREEAALLRQVFNENGLNVESVMCKVGSFERDVIDIEQEELPVMCNPIAQAKFLEKEDVDFIVVFGLCVGHDTLFFKYNNIPATVFAVKDRLYNHRPLEAIEEAKELKAKKISLKNIK